MDVREKAVSYLNSRPRTRQEVMRHLKDKGFSEEEILETVKELEEYHYIDDLLTAGCISSTALRKAGEETGSAGSWRKGGVLGDHRNRLRRTGGGAR